MEVIQGSGLVPTDILPVNVLGEWDFVRMHVVPQGRVDDFLGFIAEDVVHGLRGKLDANSSREICTSPRF
jgi:hypothetical protein